MTKLNKNPFVHSLGEFLEGAVAPESPISNGSCPSYLIEKNRRSTGAGDRLGVWLGQSDAHVSRLSSGRCKLLVIPEVMYKGIHTYRVIDYARTTSGEGVSMLIFIVVAGFDYLGTSELAPGRMQDLPAPFVRTRVS